MATRAGESARRGREVTLDELKDAEKMRAAEVELSVPDGNSVTMLNNVIPVQLGDGEVESVIVTLQDLASFEAQERRRAAFLAMVSHELRPPLTLIKGLTTVLLSGSRTFDMNDAPVRPHSRRPGRPDETLIGDRLDVGVSTRERFR